MFECAILKWVTQFQKRTLHSKLKHDHEKCEKLLAQKHHTTKRDLVSCNGDARFLLWLIFFSFCSLLFAREIKFDAPKPLVNTSDPMQIMFFLDLWAVLIKACGCWNWWFFAIIGVCDIIGARDVRTIMNEGKKCVYISTTASSIRRVLYQQALNKNVLIETTTKPTIRAHFPQLSLDTKINAILSSHKTYLITAVNYIFIEIFGAWIRRFFSSSHTYRQYRIFFCWNTLRKKANGRCSGKKALLI